MAVQGMGGIPCIDIILKKIPGAGLGFSIAGGIDQDKTKNPFIPGDEGIFVSAIKPGTPAELAGLAVGDKILEVNGLDLTMSTHSHAIKLLTKEKFTVLKMKIYRRGI
ncbi:tax1-binding protein 3-like [Acanthaster planci]|uniref:Tax1-binding protein 3-like n=1 Tax=Acanthaster planci TaxID=133434 RepID=A0A8B7Y460_ACAPL|nr:tax1-binding protein 3-like [Acanthaster planci]